MNDLDDPIRLLTLSQAANILKVSKRTLLRMIQNGNFPAFQVGKQWRILESRFQNWVEGDGSVVLSKRTPNNGRRGDTGEF
jgi:excisionase family DNA binding protein